MLEHDQPEQWLYCAQCVMLHSVHHPTIVERERDSAKRDCNLWGFLPRKSQRLREILTSRVVRLCPCIEMTAYKKRKLLVETNLAYEGQSTPHHYSRLTSLRKTIFQPSSRWHSCKHTYNNGADKITIKHTPMVDSGGKRLLIKSDNNYDLVV